MDLWQYAVAVATVTVGACVQGSLGFGLGLLSAPILALVAQRLVPVPLLVLAIVTTGWLVIREWRSLDPRPVGWALLGRVPGSAAGALAVAWLPARGLDATFGVLILLAVGLSAVGWAPAPTPGTLVTAGTLSGVMGTAVSTGAAPVALVYQRASGAHIRGALSGFFFAGSCISLTLLAAFGQVGGGDLRLAGTLVPGLAVGLIASRYAAPHLDASNTRTVVLAVAGLASIGLLIRAIVG